MPEIGESSYRRFLRGDQDALEELIRTYSDPLVRYCYCYLKSAAAAEDVMAETFATVFIRGRRLSDPDKLRPYLYKVARSKSIDYLRRYKYEVPLSDVENVLFCGDAEADVLRRSRDEAVYACMQALPEQYRAVLQLAYFDGFPIGQICVILGKSSKQVYNLLARAKVALRELLEKEGITHEDL